MGGLCPGIQREEGQLFITKGITLRVIGKNAHKDRSHGLVFALPSGHLEDLRKAMLYPGTKCRCVDLDISGA